MSRIPRRSAAPIALVALLALVVCLAPSRAAAQTVSKVVDPDTSSRWEEVLGGDAGGGGYSTDQAGRIWVDKSVYGSSEEARASGLDVTLADERYGFVVGLSALSSAVSVRQEGGPAHDVVFVVSTNQTLSSLPYGGRPQAAYLADALNTSIARLMEQNDGTGTTTRVSVIGYDSDVVTLMPLDVYKPSDGRYVSFSPGSGGNPGSLEVVANAQSGTKTTSAELGSGSYLQRAVHLAGETLVGAASDPSAPGREPVIVVMGIETPPMASTHLFDPPAYEGNGTDFLGPLPGSHTTGYGTDALLATLLTMRHEANRVDEAWGEGHELALYTVGLDTSETAAYLLETPLEQADHKLPGSGAATGQDLRDNLESAARAYADAAAADETDVTLDLFGSGTSGLVATQVTLPVEDDLVPADDPLAVSPVDDYLPARSARALTWALGSAVGRSLGISYTAPASGGPGEDAPGGSRVQLTDQVGAGMQVARVDGIVYGSHLLSGAGAARAVEVSLEDPYNPDATHEFSYLVEAMNARYGLGNDAYFLFYRALEDGQFSYASDSDFSNHASWYVDDAHRMVPSQGLPYTFATQAEVDAAADGDWQEHAPEGVRATIEAARAAGATAVCETYFYIGDYRSQYSGGDVTLYDFVVMVETDLETGRQELLLSVPVEAVPALRADVSVRADGTATMRLDDALETTPIRLAYQVAPTPAVSALLERMEAGELVSDAELEGALGEKVAHSGLASRLIYASGFTGSGDSAEAGTTAGAWAAQTNSYYAFTRDTPLFVRQGDDYAPLTTPPATGETYYFERTVYSASHLSPDAEAQASVEQEYVPYVMAGGRRAGAEPLRAPRRAVRGARRDPALRHGGGARVRGEEPQRHRECALRGAPLRGGSRGRGRPPRGQPREQRRARRAGRGGAGHAPREQGRGRRRARRELRLHRHAPGRGRRAPLRGGRLSRGRRRGDCHARRQRVLLGDALRRAGARGRGAARGHALPRARGRLRGLRLPLPANGQRGDDRGRRGGARHLHQRVERGRPGHRQRDGRQRRRARPCGLF